MIFWIILLIIFASLLFWRFWFLRNPPREIPKGKNIVSPADGKVNKIIKSNSEVSQISKGIGKFKTIAKDVSDDYILVNIVMTPFDVHFQRAPIKGKVTKTKHTKGKFKNAVTKNIALENEHNEILIEGELNIKIIQIAGFLARRIKCYVKTNNIINKGQVVGLINLGSQVTIIMPAQINLNIKEGQRVKAGETIIGDYKWNY
ncbi:MAG: phosphatidylserine decarboxylase [Bacteroidota bacterium]